VEGFFPSIDGAMTVTSVLPDPNSDPSGPTFNQNVKSSYKFSLQINSNSFFDVTSTGLCGKNVPCGGWVQFVYMMRLDGSADLYNQYWFWDKIHNNTYCAEAPTTKTAPDTTDIARWKPADQGCYGNSPTINIASQPGKTPIDILKSIRLQGISEGENDHIIVYYEDKAYDSKPFKSPFGKLLSQNWTSAEFNIFGGTSNAPMAKFNIETNIATTLNVKTIVHNNTSNAPTCKLGGTTFEQNNLDLLAGTCSTTAGAAPSITFWESNVPHITVTPNAETGGAISPSTIVELLPGWTAKFTVMPDAGYYIQSVSGCNGSQLSGSSNSMVYQTGPVTANCTVKATFTKTPGTSTGTSPPTYKVTPLVNVAGRGTVSPSDPQQVASGKTVAFKMTPNPGYAIDTVGANGCPGSFTAGNTAGATYTTQGITANCSVTAVFVPTYTVTANQASGGVIDPSGNLSTPSGRPRTFTLTPNSGYYLQNITAPLDSGCYKGTWDGSKKPIYTYTTGPITASCSITPTFSKN
jgi:hypothetical protein